jgi:hypothetical protein
MNAVLARDPDEEAVAVRCTYVSSSRGRRTSPKPEPMAALAHRLPGRAEALLWVLARNGARKNARWRFGAARSESLCRVVDREAVRGTASPGGVDC